MGVFSGAVATALNVLMRIHLLYMQMTIDTYSVRLLLSDTKLGVNVNGTMFLEFQSFLVIFRGTVCQGACLPLSRLVPCVISESNSSLKSITKLGLPLDTEYADDVDFPGGRTLPYLWLSSGNHEHCLRPKFLQGHEKIEF